MAKKMTEIEKMNGMCFWLINQCIQTNAETMTIQQDNVWRKGKALGSWKITVEKSAMTSDTPLEEV